MRVLLMVQLAEGMMCACARGLDIDVRPVVVSQDPYIVSVNRFATAEECNAIIEVASTDMQRSGIEGHTSASGARARTSSTRWLNDDEFVNEPMRRLRKRMVDFVMSYPHDGQITSDWHELLQVLKYTYDQQYWNHVDYFNRDGYRRSATLIVFLSDVAAGGHTVFPFMVKESDGTARYEPKKRANFYDPKQSHLNVLNNCDILDCNLDERYLNNQMRYCCCSERLSFKPTQGSAILFYPQMPNGTGDDRVAHGACPVTHEYAIKWAAQQWFQTGTRARPEL